MLHYKDWSIYSIFYKFLQLATGRNPNSCGILLIQWCRKLKHFGGASSKGWALPGRNRVNWSPKFWVSPPPSSVPASLLIIQLFLPQCIIMNLDIIWKSERCDNDGNVKMMQTLLLPIFACCFLYVLFYFLLFFVIWKSEQCNTAWNLKKTREKLPCSCCPSLPVLSWHDWKKSSQLCRQVSSCVLIIFLVVQQNRNHSGF